MSVPGAALRGLTSAEVAARVADGLVNDVPPAPTRTIGQIVRANVLTRFNAVITALFAVIVVIGPLRDGLFFNVVVINTLAGIVQEIRAKRTLDRLAVLNAPHARAVRDGVPREVAVNEVVLDDLLEAAPGDQIVVDGVVEAGDELEVDESLLTGEAEPVAKHVGDEVLSGSFVVSGAGRYRASRVGAHAYAARLAEEARRFTLTRSELRNGIDRIVGWASIALVPAGVLLFVSQLRAGDGVEDGLRATVGGVVAMIPEGLVLLTSIAFAVGVVRLARRKTLVQELPAVEMLARVDVLCVDKTGTITQGAIAEREVVALGDLDRDGLDTVLRALVASESSPNPTLGAIAAAHPPQGDEPVPRQRAAFSSARKWSGATFGAEVAGATTWVLGAPDVLLDAVPGSTEQVRADAEDRAQAGERVLLLACSHEPLAGEALPAGLRPAALVCLEDVLRPDATDTFAFFAAQQVTIKVISGDHPATVSAVARRAGIPGAERAVDARTLPEDPDALAAAMDASTVFGRVTPQQKRSMVRALQANGHVVAMTGDGVNDVLALKDADIGVSMGSGSAATRAVAQLVLLDNAFSSMPVAVAEGRRVINNLERVARAFVTKTVYAVLFAVVIGASALSYPFLPRHLTVVSSLTIGIPTFFLALGPNRDRATPGFVRKVLSFSAPAGVLSAAAALTAYLSAKVVVDDLTTERTTAALTLIGCGLVVLAVLSRPLVTWKLALVAAMAAGFAVLLVVPPWRAFFALNPPGVVLTLVAAGLVAAFAALLPLAVAATSRLLAPRAPARR